MSFLDNFSFAFQEIILKQKIFAKNDYGEPVENSENIKNFLGIIQENKNIWQTFADEKNLLKIHTADAIMRTNIDIEAKINDEVESFWTKYLVTFTKKVIIEGVHDHNLAFLKYF